MAKLLRLPEQSIIDGMAGTIDYYYWKGIPCARSWPKKPSMPRSPAVQARNAEFAAIARSMPSVAPEARAAAEVMARQSPLTWKDVYTSILLGGTYGD